MKPLNINLNWKASPTGWYSVPPFSQNTCLLSHFVQFVSCFDDSFLLSIKLCNLTNYVQFTSWNQGWRNNACHVHKFIMRVLSETFADICSCIAVLYCRSVLWFSVVVYSAEKRKLSYNLVDEKLLVLICSLNEEMDFSLMSLINWFYIYLTVYIYKSFAWSWDQ